MNLNKTLKRLEDFLVAIFYIIGGGFAITITLGFYFCFFGVLVTIPTFLILIGLGVAQGIAGTIGGIAAFLVGSLFLVNHFLEDSKKDV